MVGDQGWCISDAFEFLGCTGFLCDYAGPLCGEGETIYEGVGCPPGYEACEAPEPLLEDCGG